MAARKSSGRKSASKKSSATRTGAKKSASRRLASKKSSGTKRSSSSRSTGAKKKSSRKKYGSTAKKEVRTEMHHLKKGEHKNRKQAIAIGLSKARRKGAKVPSRKAA